MKSKIPDKIYLQWYGDGSPDDGPIDPMLVGPEISWCAEKVFPHDVEYERAYRVRAFEMVVLAVLVVEIIAGFILIFGK